MLFAWIAFFGLVTFFVFAGRMTAELKQRGVKSSYWLLRFISFAYAARYLAITQEETGKPGSLYRPFIISAIVWISSLIIALLVLISKRYG